MFFPNLDNITYKNDNEFYDLTLEERDYLIDIMVDNFSERIDRLSDELLMSEASDMGII